MARPCSPHTRGWTDYPEPFHELRDLFPAHAGMDREGASTHLPWLPVPRTRGDGPGNLGEGTSGPVTVPRTRGDGPLLSRSRTQANPCSPHTRGWTAVKGGGGGRGGLFPAHAGMDRAAHRQQAIR